MMFDFVSAPVRQTAAIRARSHRPWPMPRAPWLMGQTWHDLLFVHWPLPPAAVERLIPRALALDTFEGRAWLGVTPFVLSGLRLAATPPLPVLSTFPELNVRTYVSMGGKPGIFFFSLDAASRLAVTTARRFYRLPYFLAEMSVQESGGRFFYRSKRADDRSHAAAFDATYWPTGGAFVPKRGSLEHFLVERYCLYSINGGGQALRAEIHHPPWRLQPAEAEIENNSMAPPGLELPNEPPLIHFGKRQDVLIWRAERTVRNPKIPAPRKFQKPTNEEHDGPAVRERSP